MKDHISEIQNLIKEIKHTERKKVVAELLDMSQKRFDLNPQESYYLHSELIRMLKELNNDKEDH